MVTALRPKPGPSRSYQFPGFHDEPLANGIRLVVAPVAKLPIATVLVIFEAGSTNDPPGKEGIAGLTASTLLEGTSRHDGAALAEMFEQLGTSLESGADWDSAFVKITVLTDRLGEALKLLGDLIMNPVFPEREIERLKAERLAEILQLETEPRGLADERFSSFLYAEDSRYSKPDAGSKESVGNLTREDVECFYRSQFTAAGTTVIIAGDVRMKEMQALVTDMFGSWRSAPVPARPLVSSPRSNKRRIHVVNKTEAPQSELRVGHVGLPRRHSDFFPTLVMNAVLGGLFGSRINLNLREVHGYTYGAHSYYDWRRGAGPFVVSTAVESDVTALAIREILLEIDRIRVEEVSDEELSLATNYLEGVFPIRYETTSAIVSALASLVIYGLPADYYDSYRRNIHDVTTFKLLEAARAHIHPTELQIVIVGDAGMVEGPLRELDAGDVSIHDA